MSWKNLLKMHATSRRWPPANWLCRSGTWQEAIGLSDFVAQRIEWHRPSGERETLRKRDGSCRNQVFSRPSLKPLRAPRPIPSCIFVAKSRVPEGVQRVHPDASEVAPALSPVLREQFHPLGAPIPPRSARLTRNWYRSAQCLKPFGSCNYRSRVRIEPRMNS